jgi:hypothetical protein
MNATIPLQSGWFGFYERLVKRLHFISIPLFCPAFATCGISSNLDGRVFPSEGGLFLMYSMKAMTWLKIGGGVLLALAAIAAADTRYAEVRGKEPMQGMRHVIASRVDVCPVAQELREEKSSCCKKDAKENSRKSEHSACCRQ